MLYTVLDFSILVYLYVELSKNKYTHNMTWKDAVTQR